MPDLTNPKIAHADERLRKETIIWLSTVRPDGRPHLVPVWFLWEGSTVLIFSQPNNQKIRNLRQNPNVMLALESNGDGSDVVTIEGKAELLTPDEVASSHPAYIEKYGEDIKGINMTPETMLAAYSQAIRITPSKFGGMS